MATPRCSYTNQHDVHCGLPSGHLGSHEPDEQLVMPDPFCLQPWDPFSLATIRAWIVCARSHGVAVDKVQRAEEHFKAIQRWQKSHGTRMPG
jgi:hypothetical protein